MDGGLAINFVVELAFTQCHATVQKTVVVVRRLIKEQIQPKQPNRQAFDDVLDSISASTISLQLVLHRN